MTQYQTKTRNDDDCGCLRGDRQVRVGRVGVVGLDTTPPLAGLDPPDIDTLTIRSCPTLRTQGRQ